MATSFSIPGQAVKTVSDKGACIAWSPLKHAPNVFATGTKEGGGGGFEDYGGELALHGFDYAVTTTACETLARYVLMICP
jgi:hypothetical protein